MTHNSSKVPTAAECFQLMKQYRMLPNIREHSIVVAEVAELLATSLKKAGVSLSLKIVIAGALLHDIGKTACLENDSDHARLGRDICLAHNFDDIADIVGEHVRLQGYRLEDDITEKEIVYYADKRVTHDRIVSLDDRLAYIMERYGQNNGVRRQAIQKNYLKCRRIEEKIFSSLPYLPEHLSFLVERKTT